MVDNEMALTFSVRNNPGVYALLVGSGISRGAEIPTGWDVIEDLIRKVAEAEGEDPEPEPTEWYREEYGEKPQYDALLEQLAPSKEDRQALLKSYFEPTDEERQKGIKTPSQAHKNIAWLVKHGYIKVIVTTNFDRLLEQALKERGVTPTVIAKPSDAEGVAPLAHEEAVILKVNGDYKASTLKNTADELENYDPEIERLIEQVLDEYGLIVCGWSGTNDSALRDLILSAKNRRYSMYWTAHSSLDETAEKLVEHRDGNAISIDGADSFFYTLKEKVQALEDAGPGAPLSKEVARERTKRYLTREAHVIDLEELIHEETESLRERLADGERFGLSVDREDADTSEVLNKYKKETETLISVSSSCAYWGPEVPNSPRDRICKSLTRLAKTEPDPRPKYSQWRDLPMYPTTLLIYSMGVAAVDSENWGTIYDILTETETRPYSSYTSEPLGIVGHPYEVGEGMRDGTEVLKDHLKDSLRDPLRIFLPEQEDYDRAFDKFNVLADLTLMDLADRLNNDRIRLPRQRYYTLDIEETVNPESGEWAPIQAGFFEGSVDRANELIDQLRY
ncbi:SIR2 family protein [Halobacteria archaeon AArc-curdl1]|uniref:SIR2 family protein n=1 Tax=Natronosalvus hydrolyticus TaxID=2979988 RepID=A0AAP2Z961_9EURY|nr:SIR2 family protein [Halobacteria archaeon AArc-curdl1]